jgi:hypothetical protein
VDTTTQASTQVDLHLNEGAQNASGLDSITGQLSFVTPDGNTGTCSMQGSGYNPTTKTLTLYPTQCPRGRTPIYFNLPTNFRNVSPTATVLAGGRVYNQNLTVTLTRMQQ